MLTRSRPCSRPGTRRRALERRPAADRIGDRQAEARGLRSATGHRQLGFIERRGVEQIPPQRIAGLVRRPSASREVDDLVDATEPRNSSSPSRRVRLGSWQTTNTSGWLPCKQRQRHAGIGRVKERALAFDHVPVVGRAAGLSISAAPAAKSDTTASIGMPPPAIMIPVWPVARKSASTPRAAKARAIASAVYFLPSAQSVPTVSRRLPLRLRPVAIGMFCGRRADVDQPPAEPFGAVSKLGNAGELRMHAADDVEARLERFDERRNPGFRDEAARIGDADHERARAAVRSLRGASASAGRG